MTKSKHRVLIGGGQAAAQTITSLRQHGCEDAITLIGAETHLPYLRPPLSKAFLKGEMPVERLLMKTPDWYTQHNVTLRLGTRAQHVDTGARRVELSSGDSVNYDTLILATGSAPRALPVPGADSTGVFYLRDIDDVIALRERAVAGNSAVIVGAGFIGLEVAASLRQLGLSVTVLELDARVLARVTGAETSAFFYDLHARHGVDIRTDTQLSHIESDNGGVRQVVLNGGERIAADLVLVGIGITPNDQLAATAGIACDDGITVDRDARTEQPDVFAVGDCAHRPLIHYDRTGRLESVHNALEQGKLAAAAILEKPRPKEDCPWFWSDQFDVKLQIAGLSTGHDHHVIRGSVNDDCFAVFYLLDGVLIAADAVNSPKDFMPAKALIANRTRCDVDLLADSAVPLKSLTTGP